MPPELWDHIADFAAAPALSRVCRATWARLQGRHLRLRVTPQTLRPALRYCAEVRAALRALSVEARGLEGPELRAAEAEWGGLRAPHLHTLSLGLHGAALHEGGMAVLGRVLAMNAAPLRCLRLSLFRCQLKSGLGHLASALSELHLHTLRLDLGGSDVGADGAEALERALSAVATPHLSLGLGYAALEDTGAECIAEALARHTRLETLALELCDNGLEGPSARALGGALGRLAAPGLTALRIGLERNAGLAGLDGGAGVQALMAGLEGLGRRAPALRRLSLGLACVELGPPGGAALAAGAWARDMAALEELALDLSANELGPRGFVPGDGLRSRVRTLRSLSLRLGGNRLGEAGARAVAGALRSWAGGAVLALRALDLNLDGNDVGDAGAMAVGAAVRALAGACPGLERLSLDVCSNDVGDGGLDGLVAELRGLGRRPGPVRRVLLDARYNDVGEEAGVWAERAFGEAAGLWTVLV